MTVIEILVQCHAYGLIAQAVMLALTEGTSPELVFEHMQIRAPGADLNTLRFFVFQMPHSTVPQGSTPYAEFMAACIQLFQQPLIMRN